MMVCFEVKTLSQWTRL